MARLVRQDRDFGALRSKAVIELRPGHHGGHQHFSSQCSNSVLKSSHVEEAAQRYVARRSRPTSSRACFGEYRRAA